VPSPLVRQSTIVSGANCDCSHDRYHCTDFATQDDAQACYWNCGAQGKGDIHKLDLNVDQLACEEFLPVRSSQPPVTPRPISTPIPTATSRPTFTPVRPTPTPTLGIGSTYLNPIDGATYVYVPAGQFIMGSTDTQVDFAFELCKTYYHKPEDCTRSWSRDEQPQHTVYLDSYWIMQTEVTNAQYRNFMDAGGYTTEAYWSPGPNVGVILITMVFNSL